MFYSLGKLKNDVLDDTLIVSIDSVYPNFILHENLNKKNEKRTTKVVSRDEKETKKYKWIVRIDHLGISNEIRVHVN